MSESRHAHIPVHWYMYPLIPVLIWAVNMVVTRYAASVIEPVSISVWRLLIAWLLMSPWLLPTVIKDKQQIARHWWQLAILGFLAMVAYQCLSYQAGHSTTATNMSIINAFTPILTIFVSLAVLKEKPGMYGALGNMISILGLFYLIGKGSFTALFHGEVHIGDGLMVLAVLAYALYGVLLKHWQLPFSVGSSVFAQTTLALFMHIPLLMVFGLQSINPHNLLPVLYAALLPSIVAPVMWMKAMHTLGPNRASMFTNLAPILTAVIAYFYLREQWTVYHTVGGIMALSGVMLAQFGKNRVKLA